MVWLVIFGILLITITVFYAWLYVRHIMKINKVLAYPVSKGRIDHAEVLIGDIHEKPEKVSLKSLDHGEDTASAGYMYYPKVSCSYEWNCEWFTTEKLGIEPVRFRKLHEADQLLRSFEKGSEIEVFVPAEEPENGIIKPKLTGYDFTAIRVLGLGGIILTTIFLLALSGTIGTNFIAGIIQAVFGLLLVWVLAKLIYQEIKPRKMSPITGKIINKIIEEQMQGGPHKGGNTGGGLIYIPFLEIHYSWRDTDYSVLFNTYGGGFKSKEKANKFLDDYQIGEDYNFLIDTKDPSYVLREKRSDFSTKNWEDAVKLLALVFSLVLMGNGLRIIFL